MHNNESIEYNVILMMKMVQVIVFARNLYFKRNSRKHKPEDYGWPWEEVAYEVIEQEIIEE